MNPVPPDFEMGDVLFPNIVLWNDTLTYVLESTNANKTQISSKLSSTLKYLVKLITTEDVGKTKLQEALLTYNKNSNEWFICSLLLDLPFITCSLNNCHWSTSLCMGDDKKTTGLSNLTE